MPIKYLMDENVDPIYQIQSRRKEPDLVVWAIGDPNTPPKGTLDPDILHRCERYSYCILTLPTKSATGILSSKIGFNYAGLLQRSQRPNLPVSYDFRCAPPTPCPPPGRG